MLTLLLASFVSTAQAAPSPWPYTVSATLPQVPATLLVYRALPGNPLAAETLQDVFGVGGQLLWQDVAGGLLRLDDGQTHMYVHDNGGAAFHDLGLLGGERRVRTVSDDALWASSEALLEDLGLLDLDLFTLEPDHIGGCTAERHGTDGALLARYSCGQAAAWRVRLDGWDTFGPGADAVVRFGDQGVIAGLEETVRNVEIAAELPTVPPATALARYLSVGAKSNAWSVLRADTTGLTTVEITSMVLGYYLPDRNASPESLVPVYRIEAVAHLAQNDAAATANILWYEPAVAGISIPELALPARN